MRVKIIVVYCFVLVAPVLGCWALGLRERHFKAVGAFVGAHRWLLVFTWLLAFAAIGALPVALLGPPIPDVHDEFSYLLGADTFAHGRWTNPPLPEWQSFETFYVQHQPSYGTAYPPGTSAILALGQVVTGQPYWGIYFVNMALAAALVWCLLAWVEFPLAVGAAFLIGSGILSTYWTHAYWGGSGAALFGTLAVGAMGRLLRGGAWPLAIALGFACSALAFIRPYEGVGLGVGIGLALCLARVPLRVWLAAAASVAVVAALWLFYNYQTTGQPLLHPYVAYLKEYMMRPMFLWQSPKDIEYRHPEMRSLFEWLFRDFWTTGQRLGFNAFAYFFPFRPEIIGLVGMLGAAAAWQSKQRWLLATLGLAWLGSALSFLVLPHYVAPFYGIFAVLLALGLRQVVAWRLGPALVLGFCLASAFGTAYATYNLLRGYKDSRLITVAVPGLDYPSYGYHYQPQTVAARKSKMTAELEARPGRHLVLVRYLPGHDPLVEWVYNGAELSEQGIVWARYYTPEANLAVRRRFADRACWILHADPTPPRLESCPPF